MNGRISKAAKRPMTHRPAPIDNPHLRLSEELTGIVEMLARNNHDLWAKRRMDEGWRFGPRRNDKTRETPLLVPYEDLPESEKQYDRDNAIETLKKILAFGGRIEAPNLSAPAGEPIEKGVAGLLASWHSQVPRQL